MNGEIRMDAVRGNRAELRETIFNYVMKDSHRLEVFTDLEICTLEDFEECVDTLFNLLNDMETNDMADIVDRINHESNYDTYEEIFYGINHRVGKLIGGEEEKSDEKVSILVGVEDLAKALLSLDINGIDWELM